MTDVIVSNKDVVVEVAQPTVPAAAVPPKIGLVEINQVVQRGSAWMTGNGPPTLAGGQYGDMYLDVDTGDMYLWDGAAWQYQGTFAPSTLTPEEILEMLITVDGDGSALDADLLDGQHGVYYAKQSDMTVQTDKNTAQDGRLDAVELKNTQQDSTIGALQTATTPANLLTAIKTVDGPGSGLDADTLDGHDTAYFATATGLTTETTNRTNADTALDAKITTEKNRNDTQDTTIATKIGDAPNDGGQYVRKNQAWALVSVPPGTIVSDTAPASPAANQMWMKASTGVLYIYYADADSSQWIQLSASPQMVNGKTARAKNRITNPIAQITQENGAALQTVSGSHVADQWAVGFTSIVGRGQRVSAYSQSPDGLFPLVQMYAATAKPSLAAADFLAMTLYVEGLDVADLAWGTPYAKPVVLRVNAGAVLPGNYGVSVTNADGTRSWLGSMNVQLGSTRTFSFAIPGDTTGTWAKDSTLGLTVRFSHCCGSNFVGVDGWQDGNKLAPAGCVNAASAINQALYLTAVGLYADDDRTGLPPPFEAPSYSDDLAKCQRYWEQSGNYDYMFSGNVTSGQAYYAAISWQVPKRTVPTLSATLLNQTSFPAAIGTLTAVDGRGGYESRLANATATGMFRSQYVGNARM